MLAANAVFVWTEIAKLFYPVHTAFVSSASTNGRSCSIWFFAPITIPFAIFTWVTHQKLPKDQSFKYAFNMLLGYKSCLDCQKNLNLDGKGRIATCLMPQGLTCLFNLSEFSDDVIWGVIRTKKLPPPGEATHTIINILCIDNFQILFTPIIFHYLG